MPSSRPRAALSSLAAVAALAATAAWPLAARAQEQPPRASGFAVERLYTSAPGGGWVVMDDLSMGGGLGGAFAISGGYAHKPLVVKDESEELAVVKHQAFAEIGAAITFDHSRLYLSMSSPLVIHGDSGVVSGSQFNGPDVDLGRAPDLVSDVRLGYDARLVGRARGAFRLGAGAQLWVPNGRREDYVTDDTYRAMIRLLVAGDVGSFTYAAHVGEHVRALDDTPTPGSPRGGELLFGLAAGPRLPVSADGRAVVVFGPELFGETALRSFGAKAATGLEALLSGRLEGAAEDGLQGRVKLGVGVGLSAQFGAPETRAVLAFELFDHGSDRDKDGVPDSKDACPDTPGVRTTDPKTNGCPAPALPPPPPSQPAPQDAR